MSEPVLLHERAPEAKVAYVDGYAAGLRTAVEWMRESYDADWIESWADSSVAVLRGHVPPEAA